MKISARSDYALRAALELAFCVGQGPLKSHAIATAQSIPAKFLERILRELRSAQLVRSQRGADGGYWLARPPEEITAADVIRAVDGPLAYVRDQRPEDVAYDGPASHLLDVWVALRASLRDVLEVVTLNDIITGSLPESLSELLRDPEAWASHD